MNALPSVGLALGALFTDTALPQGAAGFHYGVDYSDNVNDFGQADQFAQTEQCGGPFGPDSTYCSTILP